MCVSGALTTGERQDEEHEQVDEHDRDNVEHELNASGAVQHGNAVREHYPHVCKGSKHLITSSQQGRESTHECVQLVGERGVRDAYHGA